MPWLSGEFTDIPKRYIFPITKNVMPVKKLVGKIEHYYDKLGVAVVDLSDKMRVGQDISIEGTITSVQQKVYSMQIDKKTIQEAGKGQLIGLRVKDAVRKNDSVYIMQ
jgi:hypothetical protein